MIFIQSLFSMIKNGCDQIDQHFLLELVNANNNKQQFLKIFKLVLDGIEP